MLLWVIGQKVHFKKSWTKNRDSVFSVGQKVRKYKIFYIINIIYFKNLKIFVDIYYTHYLYLYIYF
jgi:hypothetical protein